MSLLRTLFIIGIIYILIRIITRFVFPYLVKRVADNVQENMNRKGDNFYQNDGSEGDITIKKSSSVKSRGNEGGEYVDYEDVK